MFSEAVAGKYLARSDLLQESGVKSVTSGFSEACWV